MPTTEMIEPLRTARLLLEPLRVEHAEEMAVLLDDPALHAFTGGSPAAVEELRRRYARQAVGRSSDGSQQWLNWIVRRGDDGPAVGYLQATVTVEDGQRGAELAWVIGQPAQGQGYGREAAQAVVDWLRRGGVATVTAHIHPDHAASSAIARRLGLTPTGDVVDGELRWSDTLGLTPRLRLREIWAAEANRIIAGAPSAADHWADGYPFEGDVIAARGYLAVTQRQGEQRPFGPYQVSRRSDGRAVGGIGFKGAPDQAGMVEVGYGLIPASRGHSYAAEALLGLMAIARAHGVRRLLAETAPDNVASQRTLLRAGFTLTGTDDASWRYEVSLER